MLQLDAALPFHRAEDDGFVGKGSGSLSLATDIRFVDLNDAGKRAVAGLLETVADALEHEPGAFLGDTEILGELDGRDALLEGGVEEDGVKPLLERDVRPLEDGADGDGELFAAVTALEQLAAGILVGFHGAAVRTNAARAVRSPPLMLQVGEAGSFVAELLLEVEQGHTLILRRSLGCVKYISAFSEIIR